MTPAREAPPADDLFRDAGATFSECRRYRYRLWRFWDGRPKLAFILLNPSRADETANDPTVERCERRAHAGGYGGLAIANIFALRSTDPKALYAADDPVGPDNDEALLDVARHAGVVVCGWGAHGAHRDRGARVAAMLREAGILPHTLRLSPNSGHPCHPLYLPYTLTPAPWPERSAA